MSRAAKLRRGRPDRVLGARVAAEALEVSYLELVRAQGSDYQITVAEARTLHTDVPEWLAGARQRAQEHRQRQAQHRAQRQAERTARDALDPEAAEIDRLFQEAKEEQRRRAAGARASGPESPEHRPQRR
ncbi:hypothetical protein [Streptomyces syringium]|uniref:hypothetical protein n=1 Tax=Streptomyces syringium TaxID=76729 RepID=UPI0037D1B1E1